MIFNNYNEIEKYAMGVIKETVMEVAENVLKDLKQFIMDELYNKYDPKDYDRTYNFLDCFKIKELKKTRSREYGFQIYIDYDVIEPSIKYGRNWGQHTNVYKDDTSQLIPKWMDEGQDSPLSPRKGIHFMDFLQDLLGGDVAVTAKLRKKFEYIGSGKEGKSYVGTFSSMGMNFNFK